MKFGKRLAAETLGHQWRAHFVDYKLLKHAVQEDVVAGDASGSRFHSALGVELSKVSAFYAAQEAELQAALDALGDGGNPDSSAAAVAAAVAALCAGTQDLRKYVVLNYVAVVKAVKKRNRHLRAAAALRADRHGCAASGNAGCCAAGGCGGGCGYRSVRAVTLLSRQHFYTSPVLAALAIRAELLAQELGPPRPAAEVAEDYGCPICLSLLRGPVALTCGHRFCWGCLVAHASAVAAHTESAPPLSAASGGKGKPSSTGARVARAALWESEGSASDDGPDSVATFGCPVCRKDHVLDLDRLAIDPHLDAFLQRLRNSRPCKAAGWVAVQPAAREAAAPALKAEDGVPRFEPRLAGLSLARPGEALPTPVPTPFASAALPAEEPLLPPQLPRHQGHLTVCLDLDGTLACTFKPGAAPALPPGLHAYVVGVGSTLNPGGVLVVERPGLGQLFQRLAPFAEVVLFTAGLEDYAAPIAAALEARYPGAFAHRLYRPATVAGRVYPCIKDLGRLGRGLGRCVLVDDSPLAFFHQPDNGVPVLQFRGDADDRLLTEAVAPLLEALSASADVRTPLARRFGMTHWFTSQGLRPGRPSPPRRAALPRAPSAPAAACAPANVVAPARFEGTRRQAAPGGVLLLCDFDKTLLDADCGEAVTEALAPELAPLLLQLESPACFVPATNAVLAEMARRGVGRQELLATLRALGHRMPQPVVHMLQWASGSGVDVRILSDANSVFIGHILEAAGLSSCVGEVLTNPAAFEEAQPTGTAAPKAASATLKEAQRGRWLGWGLGGARVAPVPAKAGGLQRLVIDARHDEERLGAHGCTLCPCNLCKGAELSALLRRSAAAPPRRIVYAGDGANDVCPALRLRQGDVVLARAGHALAAELSKRSVSAAVREWATHEELAALVRQAVAEA